MRTGNTYIAINADAVTLLNGPDELMGHLRHAAYQGEAPFETLFVVLAGSNVPVPAQVETTELPTTEDDWMPRDVKVLVDGNVVNEFLYSLDGRV